MGILSFFSGIFSLITGLLGLKRDATLKQAGIDSQQAADLRTEVTQVKAEAQAEANAGDASKSLRDGTF